MAVKFHVYFLFNYFYSFFLIIVTRGFVIKSVFFSLICKQVSAFVTKDLWTLIKIEKCFISRRGRK